MNQLIPGSICWAAFLKMGARHENSPTILFAICYHGLSPQQIVFINQIKISIKNGKVSYF